jgi:hypothetical protein
VYALDFGGLTGVNIEASSSCNKQCFCCGRRKVDREMPGAIKYGFMDFELLKIISKQLPESRLLCQFHRDGEFLLYPQLAEGLELFKRHIRCVNTNGILLLERFDEIINNLDTITISMLPEDDIWESQYETLIKFLEKKGTRLPNVIIRMTGHFDDSRRKLYEDTGCMIVNRILHDPMGSWKYQYPPTKTETGICQEMISKLSIDRYGNCSPCVRFDFKHEWVIGNLNNVSLLEIWNSPKRQEWLNLHVQCRRNEIPFCSKCDFWGVPRGE